MKKIDNARNVIGLVKLVEDLKGRTAKLVLMEDICIQIKIVLLNVLKDMLHVIILDKNLTNNL